MNSTMYNMARGISAALRIPDAPVDIEDLARTIDSFTDIRLPFRMATAIVMVERVRVVPSVLHPTKASVLCKQLLEMEDGDVAIISDDILRGKGGVFAVTWTECDAVVSMATRWLGAMHSPALLVGLLKPDISIIAAPLTAFA